jgi:Cysteine-rich CPCC
MSSSTTSGRVHCPCCGYPTLTTRHAYHVCKLCNWEDDGQGDEDEDDVRNGPNAGHSLTQARANFKRYRVMYAPGLDPRSPGAASQLEFDTKGRLMAAFELLGQGRRVDVDRIQAEVASLERTLYEEALRRILEYDHVRVAVIPPAVTRRRWKYAFKKLVGVFGLG